MFTWKENGKIFIGEGIYHLTFVVAGRRPLLGQVVGMPTVERYADTNASIPADASVENFPHADDLNHLILVGGEFRKSLSLISAKGGASTDDELMTIAMVFLGAWKSLNSKERLPLSEIVEWADKAQNFNLSIYPDRAMKEECKSILDGIGDFEYKICGRELVWSLGFLNGTCQWTGLLENAIINNKPTTKREIAELLN